MAVINYTTDVFVYICLRLSGLVLDQSLNS